MERDLLMSDLIDLAGRLRQERLFIMSEQSNLQDLNEKVVCSSSRLAQLAWVVFQQRVNLNRLVVSQPDCSPAMCCRRAYSLESSQFVDAYKVLRPEEVVLYGELFKHLRASPELLAACLTTGEKVVPELIGDVINSLVSGLFGSCLLSEDKAIVLRLLKILTELQLVPSENPRRLLRHGSCAFARLYAAFHEGLFSAKLFLTAALHGPINRLMEDERFLDIDPEKAAIRYPPVERMKKFGKEGTDEYKANLQSYRNHTIASLVAITKHFIVSLQENLHCFPVCVSWLVHQIFHLLKKSGLIQEKEIFAIITELVFTHFICPAIVNPEPYGITDAPISHVARFNLIQVAQILQMLAMCRYESVDPRVEDLYLHFNKDSVSAMLDFMLESGVEGEEPPSGDNVKLQGLARSAALLTEAEIHNLVSFLRTIDQSNQDCLKDLKEPLSNIPQQTANGHSKAAKRQPTTQRSTKLRNSIGSDTALDNEEDDERQSQPVLVIPFDINVEPVIGLLSEQKVLAGDLQAECDLFVSSSHVDCSDSQYKRTRFSVSHDDGSIGNTSDNLEAVSEAASNHSVTSSLELEPEDQNDNLSDMMSANVSGRGSPNISGRDTPSSQMTEGDDAPPPPTVKQSRFDIDDKFGKFQIKKIAEGGDETVSLVSDTWSTDVLASDSETLEPAPPSEPLQGPQLLDVLETASEAWSTDVVASDSERLTEVDTDDTASVARSDETARSEVESRGESELADEATHLSVKEETRSIVPVSPQVSSNGTGRGGSKSDYGRRTAEYVDLNARNFKQGSCEDQRGTDSVLPLDLKPALVASSPSVAYNRKSMQSSSQGVSVDEVDTSTTTSMTFQSSMSLASTSSSGSTSEPRHKSTEMSPSVLPLANGSVPIVDSAVAKPSSTGAIPKSISFDKTAEKGDKESDKDGKQRRGLFSKFKLPGPFNRRTSRKEDMSRFDSTLDSEERLRRGLSEDSPQNIDSSDAILEKYRSKSLATERSASTESANLHSDPIEDCINDRKEGSADERLVIDPNQIETSYAFVDAKKKLRLVLSTAYMQQVPDTVPLSKCGWGHKDNELVAFLQLQLAEAINLQDRSLLTQLHETLRCVRLFDNKGCRKLFESLREDFKSRGPYVAYLVRCRQTLLSALAHLDRLTKWLESDKSMCSAFLIAVCVNIFLEKREEKLESFSAEFQQLTMVDEKNDLLNRFLQMLSIEMAKDSLWQAASDSQLEEARLAVERAVISRVYTYAMYPNGDGDINRDQVLHEHINKLAKVITPKHEKLRIPKILLYECPWPSAQAEIATLSAYKTPRDKLQCVFRCATTIVNLLNLAGTTANADELLPVMVYVIIQANPPSLLSTMQYVNSFYTNRLEGEEGYWWVQFCSAIQFIKTMDYHTSE